MKLELAEFPVKNIRLGHRFKYQDEILDVDEGALLALVSDDPRITDASLDVAAPGEKTRITGIRDIVEPRYKVSGSGQVFPGVVGPVGNVGDGRTHRLSGMTVIAAAEYEGTIRAGTTVQRSAILDMSGPGAEVSRFSTGRHLVVSFKITAGLGELDAHAAIQSAECKIAQRLAQVTAELTPPKLFAYDLSEKNPALPNVMLVQGCITDPQHVHSGVGYYGLSLRNSLSTFVYPNEIFDKEVGAQNAASLARAMGADGVLITWIGGGNAFVDVMFTVRACEHNGIKTTLVTYEHGGKEGKDSPVLFYIAEADAIVSTGSLDKMIELPAMDKVIGPYEQIKILPFPGAASVAARGVLSLESRDVMIGGADLWGETRFRCAEF